MATITQRSTGWQVQIRRQGFPQKSKVFAKRSDAEIWARQIENEMDRGLVLNHIAAEKTTVGALLIRFRQEVTPRKKGWREETSRLKNLERHSFALRSLSRLSSTDVASYREERLQKLSATTDNKELELLTRVIETARREWGLYIPDNPAKLVRRPKPNRSRDRRLEQGEEQKLLESTASNELISIIQLALETAMRRSEIANMAWSHIDFSRRTLRIPETKTDSPRTVPLSRKAVDVLQGVPPNGGLKVFGVKAGSISQAFERACKRAGIVDLHFHDLRHEAISRLFEKGLNPIQVAAVSGHKTMDMLKRYTHLRAESLVALLG